MKSQRRLVKFTDPTWKLSSDSVNGLSIIVEHIVTDLYAFTKSW